MSRVTSAECETSFRIKEVITYTDEGNVTEVRTRYIHPYASKSAATGVKTREDNSDKRWGRTDRKVERTVQKIVGVWVDA